MKKKDLIQLFSDASVQNGETYEQRCVIDSDFEKLAETILEHFESLDEIILARYIVNKYKTEDDYIIANIKLFMEGEEATDNSIGLSKFYKKCVNLSNIFKPLI